MSLLPRSRMNNDDLVLWFSTIPIVLALTGGLAEVPEDIHVSRTLTERRIIAAKRRRTKNSVMQARVFVKCPILFGHDHSLVALCAKQIF